MERCQEHMVVDGEVERSIKEAGNVVRTRRCKKCGSRFRTFEATDDAVAFKQAGYDKITMELRKEMEHYKGMVVLMRELFEGLQQLNEELIRRYE